MRTHRGESLQGHRSAQGKPATGGGLRHRPRRARCRAEPVSGHRLQQPRRTAGQVGRGHGGAVHPERAASLAGHPGGAGRPPRDDRKAHGHPLERWPAHGARLRRGRCAPAGDQAEPSQCHAAAGQARHGEGPVRAHLHGHHQRVLVAPAVLLRQRILARHLGIRRRRAHEPGQPLCRPGRLADRAGGERAGLRGNTGAQHPGRRHGHGRHPLALGCARLGQRHHAGLPAQPRRFHHHPRRARHRARRRRGGQ